MSLRPASWYEDLLRNNALVVVDEVDISFSELPMRGVTLVEKMGEDWKITFSSVALLVNNNDLSRIDSLLTQ